MVVCLNDTDEFALVEKFAVVSAVECGRALVRVPKVNLVRVCWWFDERNKGTRATLENASRLPDTTL